MSQSVIARNGGCPLWPLGLIVSVTPGVPVPIMSLIDAAWAANPTTVKRAVKHSIAQQIIWKACRAGASHGTAAATGNVYRMLHAGTGSRDRDDYGQMIDFETTGQTFVDASSPLLMSFVDLYDLWIDADNAGDGYLITAVMPGV